MQIREAFSSQISPKLGRQIREELSSQIREALSSQIREALGIQNPPLTHLEHRRVETAHPKTRWGGAV